MKNFEREIRKRLKIEMGFSIIGGMAIIITLILNLVLGDRAKESNDFYVSVLIGMFGGFEAFSIPPIIRYRKALKNHENLETLHINETDERNKMLDLKTCRTCFYIALTLLGYAGLFASLFNHTVFYTLGATLIVLCILYLIVKIIYTHQSIK